MFSRKGVGMLEIAVFVSFVVFLMVSFDEPTPNSGEKNFAAVGASTVEVPVLSYCAHWYARNGTACINDAKAGDEVVVSWDSSDLSAAIARCQASGCKISFYCESGQGGAQRCDIPAIEATFKKLVTTYNAQMFLPFLEIDGIRDLSAGSRTQLLQQLAAIHWSLVLKNMNTVGEFSQTVPVARVIYEDIGPSGNYASEMRQLAQQYPNLLISGILHSGCYASSLGGSCYPAVSREQAVQSFQPFSQMKNVELFYGLPASFEKWKALDGALGPKTSGVGTMAPTSPGMFAISPSSPGSSISPTSMFTNPQPIAPIPYAGTPVAMPTGASLYGAYTPQTVDSPVAIGVNQATTAVQGIAAIARSGDVSGVVNTTSGAVIPVSSGVINALSPATASSAAQAATSKTDVYAYNTFISQDAISTSTTFMTEIRARINVILSSLITLLQNLITKFSGTSN